MERLTNLSTDNWGVRGLNHLFRIAADNGYTVAVGSLLAAATEYNTALHHAAWGGHHGPVAIRPRDRHRGPWLRQADTVAQSFMARTRGHDWAAARPRGRHRGQGFRALDAATNSYLERIWGNDWVAAWPRGRRWGRGLLQPDTQNTSAFRMHGHKTTVDGEADISSKGCRPRDRRGRLP